MIDDTESSGMKVWVNLPGKESRTSEVLVEGNGNTEWIVEERSHRHQL